MALPLWTILVATFGLIWYLKTRFGKKATPPGLKELPGPKGLPIVGSIFQMGKYPAKAFAKWAEEYGPIYQVDIADKHFVVVSDPKMTREIFSTDPSFTGRDFLSTLTLYEDHPDYGIIGANGERWEVHRRFLLRQMRDFGFGKSSMETLILEELNEIIEYYKKLAGQPVTAIRDKLRLSVVNSLWSILTSQKFKQDDPELTRLAHNISKKFNDMVQNLGPLLLFPTLMKFVIPEKSGYRSLRQVFEECREKFQKTVNEHKSNFQEDSMKDFIDVYLAEMRKAEGDPKSFFHGEEAERQLVNILFDLFFAGTDTTTTTLDWAILFLCKCPHVQKRLQQEIEEHTGNSRRVSLSDRPNMPYTLALIDEILRYSSIVPDGLVHWNLAEGKQFRGYHIPKDTLIQPSLWLVHHNPKVWGDPENFRPERFLSEDGKKYVKSENVQAFQPGKRECVGQTLARDSIFLYLTNIFQQFSIEFDPNMEKIPGVGLDESELGFVRAPKPFSVIMKNRLQN